MDYQYHMPKKYKLFHNQIFYNNMTRLLTMDIHPHFTMDINL